MGALTDLPKRIWAIDRIRMLCIAAGIMICFVYFGIMQEKIMRGCFGGELVEGKCVNGEKYEFEITLVGILALWYAILARSKYEKKRRITKFEAFHIRGRWNRTLDVIFCFAKSR